MAKRKRRTFTPEQKAQALRLAEELGNVSQAAQDLGMPSDLYPKNSISAILRIEVLQATEVNPLLGQVRATLWQ